ncbi:SAM-dependent methyltransferase [Desulfonema magnum]|uniref:SAM-dependent methyltransferase n=1 Tax=Desulfonema magnum TaxID=45655 RepID=A0A975BFR9_9BACT|nr:SAM-dependent methyltransferase [Desulfonema magnum]
MPVNCNFCGHSNDRIIAKENGLIITECQKCGLVYVNPRPTDDEIKKFYQQYLHPATSSRWKEVTVSLFHTDIKRIERYQPEGRILDIGCGFGFFLSLMQKRGWEVYGCDLSEAGVKYATEYLKLTGIKYGPFQKHIYPPNYFDVISAWYVLHHAADPRQVLRNAHASLKKGGIIAIRVPNHNLFKWLWWLKKFDCHALRSLLRTIRKETADPRVPYNVLDPPVHLYAFTPEILASFLEDTGFSIVRIYNDGMVNRGNFFNRIIDGTITHAADIIKQISKDKTDISISFSIYAKKV